MMKVICSLADSCDSIDCSHKVPHEPIEKGGSLCTDTRGRWEGNTYVFYTLCEPVDTCTMSTGSTSYCYKITLPPAKPRLFHFIDHNHPSGGIASVFITEDQILADRDSHYSKSTTDEEVIDNFVTLYNAKEISQ